MKNFACLLIVFAVFCTVRYPMQCKKVLFINASPYSVAVTCRTADGKQSYVSKLPKHVTTIRYEKQDGSQPRMSPGLDVECAYQPEIL